MVECKPKHPPYLKDLQKMAKDAKIPNYGKMRKEELCEALGLIEKAGPYEKRKVKKSKKSAKKDLPKITKAINAYVKENKMVSRTVKENFKPPPGMSDHYYLWGKYQGTNDPLIKHGSTIRIYPVPNGTLVNSVDGKNVPYVFGETFTGYLGNNPKNMVIGSDYFLNPTHSVAYEDGIGHFVAPPLPFSEIKKDPGFRKYLKAIDETEEDFKKIYVRKSQYALRKAGQEYSFP